MESHVECLESIFKFERFQNNQEEIVRAVMNGEDSIVIMPTAGGKSLCYQIPAICMKGIVIVVSPLISLMQDQVRNLTALGIRAGILNSETIERSEVFRMMLDEALKIVYTSPEFLCSNIHIFKRCRISFFAIDESHCVSSWGHDFRPQYKQLSKIREIFPDSGILALTATADKITVKDIMYQLKIPNAQVFRTDLQRRNIALIVKKRPRNVMKQILHEITDARSNGIIYCSSRKKTESIYNDLKYMNIKCSYYHAGMSAEQKSQNYKYFIDNKNVVMVATVAFGMGVNIKNVEYIIHADTPRNLEAYYQETGRCGRSDNIGRATILYSNADIDWYRDTISDSDANFYYRMIQTKKLKCMQKYCESKHMCRSKMLARYFGQEECENCGMCDICYLNL